MSAEELQNPPAKAASPSIVIKNSPRTYNQVNVPRKYTAGKRRFTIYWTWSYPVGGQSRRHRAGQSLLDHDGGAAGRVAARTRRRNGRAKSSCRASRGRWNYSTSRLVRFQSIVGEPPDSPSPFTSASIKPGSGSPRRASARGHGHTDGLRPGFHGDRAGGERRRDRGAAGIL